jgi:hypothetical protein
MVVPSGTEKGVGDVRRDGYASDVIQSGGSRLSEQQEVEGELKSTWIRGCCTTRIGPKMIWTTTTTDRALKIHPY